MKWILLSAILGFGNVQTNQVKVYDEFSAFESDYLSNLSGDTTYVINFWATWCAPCVKELPYFEQLRERNEMKPFKMILVSLDFKSKLEGVKSLIAKKGIQSEVVLLADGRASEWIDLVDSTWSGAIPATLVIKNNKRYFYEKSYESYKELEEDILKSE
jgi:thiol-disulfide isomerase/thioredoxin